MHYMYEKNSGKDLKPGHKPHMSVSELMKFTEKTGLINDCCWERDVHIAFNLSKEWIMDEYKNEATL